MSPIVKGGGARATAAEGKGETYCYNNLNTSLHVIQTTVFNEVLQVL